VFAPNPFALATKVRLAGSRRSLLVRGKIIEPTKADILGAQKC